MIRLLLALFASTVVGLLLSAALLAASDTSFRSADATGFAAVSVAIACVLGLFLYAPAAWLLRRRGLKHRLLGALVIGIVANGPLFAALLILDRIGGLFAQGEALIVAALAAAIGATHGFVALRVKRPEQPLEPPPEQSPG